MKHTVFCVALTLLWTSLAASAVADSPSDVATFSIVGFDPETGELGVAVASKFLAVGAVEEARRACKINPNLPEAVYDLACYYSLSGDEGKALETLERALTLEPKFKTMAKGDPDFETLRASGRFKAMLEP